MAQHSELEEVIEVAENDTAPSFGHIPLLWILTPLVICFAACFAWEWHLPVFGAILSIIGGVAAVIFSFYFPKKIFPWRCAFLTAMAGFSLLFFDIRVTPIADWSALPPREAELVLRWEQIFSRDAQTRSVTGIAHILDAPVYLEELIDTDVYCQMRRPVPENFQGVGAIFRAKGVVADVRQQFTENDADGFTDYLVYRRAPVAFTRGKLMDILAPPSAFQSWCDTQATRIETTLRRGLEMRPELGDLLVAMILGRISVLSEEYRQTFIRTGTMHLFAISGLHIGVISAALFWFGKAIRFRDTFWRLIVIFIMLIFVLITGASPSAFRAWLMITCMLLARIFKKDTSPFSGLILAATAVLLYDPLTLLNIGFQLSYCVVAALLLHGLPMAKWLNERWHFFGDIPEESLSFWRRSLLGLKRGFVDSFGIGVASTVAGAPLVIDHFNLFSAGSIFVNLLAVPLSMPVMLFGFIGLLMGFCSLGVAAVPFNFCAGIFLFILESFVRMMSLIPGVAWKMEFRTAWLGTVLILFSLGFLLFQASVRRFPGRFLLVWPVLVCVLFLLCSKFVF